MGTVVEKTWSEWINEKYIEYRAGRGGAAGSITAFAKQFKATHSTVIGWMREGASPPRKAEYIKRLLELYPDEAYDILGIPKSVMAEGRELSQHEQQVLDLLGDVPENHKEDALAVLENYLFKHGFRRVK